MKKIDELKKWLNELNSHYASLQKMKALLPQDRNYWDAYNSVMTKITEIEASEISSSAVLAVSLTFEQRQCPVCKTNINVEDNYCSGCGQKFKWQ